ncbi:MAG: ATP-binding protein [Methylococcaceae bacterium]|jgi:two-component system sensor histidine kinase FlrB
MNTNYVLQAQKTQQLTDAFRLFNELSEHLTASYQALEEQVAKLHDELAFAHSERLKTLEEKEKLADWLEKILAALPAGVIVIDDSGIIVDCNQLAYEFLGKPLKSKAWVDVFNNCLLAIAGNPHEYQLANGQRISLTHKSAGKQAGQIILLSDISQMRELEDIIHQQQKLSAMGEMVASLAHQVRTPLATAIIYASQLNNVALDVDKRQRFSTKILERLHYLERQINDMLIFAKDGKLAMGCFSLNSLLAHLADALKDYAGESDITCEILNQAHDDEMLGNENALRGALMNLLNNAVDALGQTGKITVLVTQIGNGQIQIDIKDTGPGMSSHLQQRVFEPFFTTKSNGTGLGLAVVDSVVKAHGGHVKLKTKFGSGTTFSLFLPCLKPSNSVLPSGFSSKNHPKELKTENQYATL